MEVECSSMRDFQVTMLDYRWKLKSDVLTWISTPFVEVSDTCGLSQTVELDTMKYIDGLEKRAVKRNSKRGDTVETFTKSSKPAWKPSGRNTGSSTPYGERSRFELSPSPEQNLDSMAQEFKKHMGNDNALLDFIKGFKEKEEMEA